MADILFVMKYPLNGQETLIPKFQGQMAAMERLGHRAWYLGWDEVGNLAVPGRGKERWYAAAAFPGCRGTAIRFCLTI